MILNVEKLFLKDLSNLDKNILDKILKLSKYIENIENSNLIYDYYDIKKLKWYSLYYRIRFWDYRLVLKITDNQIIFLRLKHRKDIYKLF